MGRVVIDEDQDYAPGCYLICKVDEDGYWDTRDEKSTVLIDLDWDYPSLAANLGFVPCECGATDGTIDCPHKSASEMIEAAREWIDEHLGEEFDDPGYFE